MVSEVWKLERSSLIASIMIFPRSATPAIFMKDLALNVEKVESRSLRLLLPEANVERFARLVPALNYSITLSYTKKSPNYQDNGVLAIVSRRARVTMN